MYILVLVVGCVCGWFGRMWFLDKLPTDLIQVRENSSGYNLINPLLLVDSDLEAPELDWVKEIIAESISNNGQNASSTSVYFRDLNVGKWTGVNEDAIYNPSSMMKVAVMMGYLKRVDTDHDLLNKMLQYKYTDDPGQNFKPLHPLSSGQHSVVEIIQSMIVGSDNDAMIALYNNDRESFVNVLKELKIPPPSSITESNFISPKMYSSIFRTLYSSTYLSRALSENALLLLANTEFKLGLVAGVPKDVVVAHKFGEHTTLKNGIYESRQLHDCGIIYYPHNPYFLCVMTKGHDFNRLALVISNISRDVYTAINKQLKDESHNK